MLHISYKTKAFINLTFGINSKILFP